MLFLCHMPCGIYSSENANFCCCYHLPYLEQIDTYKKDVSTYLPLYYVSYAFLRSGISLQMAWKNRKMCKGGSSLVFFGYVDNFYQNPGQCVKCAFHLNLPFFSSNSQNILIHLTLLPYSPPYHIVHLSLLSLHFFSFFCTFTTCFLSIFFTGLDTNILSFEPLLHGLSLLFVVLQNLSSLLSSIFFTLTLISFFLLLLSWTLQLQVRCIHV